MHTTNYFDTFISVADDCPVTEAEVPPSREPRSSAQIQYEMLAGSPYVHTSDEVLYAANGERRGLSREEFFSNGQPCLRSSPLTKRYGWGVHANSDGKVALLAMESDEYAALVNDPGISQLQAMRSSRK
jgi:hypothetical protein